ncbi:MAG TPA: tetratricopeptide repeat protein, partial [Kofleriaceae bacterium]
EAAATVRASVGEIHPILAAIAAQKTLALLHLGRTDEAVATARAGAAIAKTAGVKDVVNTVDAALGVALTRAHQFDEALALLDHSLAIDREADGDDGYNVASDYNNRCDLLQQMRRSPDAIASGREAIRIWSKLLAPDASELGVAYFNLALAELADQPKAARDDAAAAVKIFETRHNPDLAVALIVRGAAAGALHDTAAARTDLEAALASFTGTFDPAQKAWAQLELARIENRDRALALATEALAVFRATNDSHLHEAEALISRLTARTP